MKKLLIIFTILMGTNAYAQSNQGSNPSVVDLAANSIAQGQTGVLEGAFVNRGFDPMPAGTFTVSFNIDDTKLEWVTPVFDETTNEGDWTLVSQSANQVVYRNTNGPVSPSETMVFALNVKVKASAPVGQATFTMNVRVTPGQAALAGNTNSAASDDNQTAFVVITSILPVTLTTFKVSKEGQTSLISWATTQETNSDHFDVEYSLNAKNWIGIGAVASKGESTALEKYFFIHDTPSNGENFYRLKMIDRDGTFAYSKIQSVTFEGILSTSMVYPNPSSDYLKLNVTDLEKVKTVKIFDINGRVIYLASGNVLTKTIDVRKINTGMYLVEIVNVDGQSRTSKVSIFK